MNFYPVLCEAESLEGARSLNLNQMGNLAWQLLQGLELGSLVIVAVSLPEIPLPGRGGL